MRSASSSPGVPEAKRSPYAVSSSKSRTGVFLGIALTLLAVGLLLLGAILSPADVMPERARVLVELRGEITFAGLGILAACAAVSLLVLFAS